MKQKMVNKIEMSAKPQNTRLETTKTYSIQEVEKFAILCAIQKMTHQEVKLGIDNKTCKKI